MEITSIFSYTKIDWKFQVGISKKTTHSDRQTIPNHTFIADKMHKKLDKTKNFHENCQQRKNENHRIFQAGGKIIDLKII